MLSNSKKFFDEILNNENLSLKQFSRKVSLNYSNLKQYRRGEKTMPDTVFNKLIFFSRDKNYWKENKREFNDNWGHVKGGIKSMNGKDKEKKLNHMRSFRKIKKVNIKLNNKFCEFYGALLGDGCISRFNDYEGKERYVIQLTGNLRLDWNYWLYLKNLLIEEYGLYCYYYERENDNTCILSIKNKRLCLELNKKFSMPIGLKYNKLKLPRVILSLPWDIKKFVLRGLFDTDGCIVANKREKYRYPWVVITSKSELFRNQLIRMLKEQNYPAYNTGCDVCVRGIENVKRWFFDIGSSNQRNLRKYEYFLKHGSLPARLGL